MPSRTITIHHSPDSDDAFMFYGLVSGAVKDEEFTFTHDLCDIESLNQRALKGELEVTAVSVHAYAYLKSRYLIMPCGASMGGADYGPKVVTVAARKEELSKKFSSSRLRIAIPGEYTSAALALRLYLAEQKAESELVPMNFNEVQHAVLAGTVDAGVIIHEGQLTHEREGLATLVDLGAWWWAATELPLPLGINVVRRDLGERAIAAATRVLKESIVYSLEHRTEALTYALHYGRGLQRDDADKFVGMYVNELTVDLGEQGRRSIELFLTRGRTLGMLPPDAQPEFVLSNSR